MAVGEKLREGEREQVLKYFAEEVHEDRLTLCDHLRQIYWRAEEIQDPELKEYIKEKCVTIGAYAKRMDDALWERRPTKETGYPFWRIYTTCPKCNQLIEIIET